MVSSGIENRRRINSDHKRQRRRVKRNEICRRASKALPVVREAIIQVLYNPWMRCGWWSRKEVWLTIFRPPNKADGEKLWGIETKRNRVWPSTWTARSPQMEASRELVWVGLRGNCGRQTGDWNLKRIENLEVYAVQVASILVLFRDFSPTVFSSQTSLRKWNLRH